MTGEIAEGMLFKMVYESKIILVLNQPKRPGSRAE